VFQNLNLSANLDRPFPFPYLTASGGAGSLKVNEPILGGRVAQILKVKDK
jgi:hypothetical protein